MSNHAAVVCPRCGGLGTLPSGGRLREIRTKAGLTVNQMALLYKSSVQFIYSVESGRISPPVNLVAEYMELERRWQKGGGK